jgi:outer membrane biosynthesis protein TonB
MKRVLALLLSVMSSAALAQTTGALDPNPAPAQPSVNDDVPPGGCMPIGLTSAGEIVFPIQCKAFIERHRGAAVEPKPAAVEEQKPAAVEDKPAANPSELKQEAKLPEAKQETKLPEAKLPEAKPPEAKPPETKQEAKQSEDAAPEDSQPANKPLETVPLPKRGEREPRLRAVSSNGCTHYRTYDPASGTYRGFDGRMRPCR